MLRWQVTTDEYKGESCVNCKKCLPDDLVQMGLVHLCHFFDIFPDLLHTVWSRELQLCMDTDMCVDCVVVK